MDETWAEETERLDSGGLDGPPDGEDERLVVGEDLLTPERRLSSAASASSSASPRLQPPPAQQLGEGMELASPAPSTEPGSEKNDSLVCDVSDMDEATDMTDVTKPAERSPSC
jgi:hypothetical protein